jgi:hypothetical protein
LTVELLLATNNYETKTGLGQCFDLRGLHSQVQSKQTKQPRYRQINS